jgi:molybdopterin/thiamine biosynthesis adenylyltransferase
MDAPIARYSRHTLLNVIGQAGQEKISRARVLVAGLGALGSTIAMLLARAGVGFLRLVDNDCPEIHNLHRQLLYTEEDVAKGLSKSEAAMRNLRAANSEVEFEAVDEAITAANVEKLVIDVQLVMDALDNTETRYLLNDAAFAFGVPYVFGGAVQTVGNIMTIIPGKTPCLRCLWPDPTKVAGHARASTTGVLSSVASAVASMQVTEAIKILVGKEEDLIQGLLVMDFWRTAFHVAPVKADPNCVCQRVKPAPGVS